MFFWDFKHFFVIFENVWNLLFSVKVETFPTSNICVSDDVDDRIDSKHDDLQSELLDDSQGEGVNDAPFLHEMMSIRATIDSPDEMRLGQTQIVNLKEIHGADSKQFMSEMDEMEDGMSVQSIAVHKSLSGRSPFRYTIASMLSNAPR